MTDQILKDYHRWLYKQANSILAPGHPDIDDLVQEGYIAMWRALQGYNPAQGSLPAWLTFKARNRMLEVISHNNQWTGRPARYQGRNPIIEPCTLSLDAEQGDGITLANLLPAADMIETALLAYHNGEIAEALSRLTPQQRRYVKARFWYGMTTQEMKSNVFGYDASSLWNSKRNGARLKLTEYLTHLADA